MGIARWRMAGIALVAVGLVFAWTAAGQAGMQIGFSVSTQVNPFYKAMPTASATRPRPRASR